MGRIAVEPILLQELIAPDLTPGQRIQLADHTLPESGIVEARELKMEQTLFPGGDYLDTQLLGLKDEDLEISGWLRDQWGSPGFAGAARRQLLELQTRRNPIWLSWGETWGRLVQLKRVEITHHVQGQQYRLTLAHLELAELAQTSVLTQTPADGPHSLDALGATSTSLQAISLPEALGRSALAVYQKVQKLGSQLDHALLKVGDVVALADVPLATITSLGSQVSQVIGVASSIRSTLTSADIALTGLPQSGEILLAGWRWQADTLRSLLRLDQDAQTVNTALKQVQGEQRQQVSVKAGDTLQRIAGRTLGDFRRWPELVALNNLIPGQPLPATLWVPL